MNLEQTISSYEPTPETIELVRNSNVAVLVGISGAGKDTIKKQLLKKDSFRATVSHTTRAPRLNDGVMEQSGVEYHFISDEKARQMVDAKEFIEVKLVHTTIYATSTEEIRLAHDEGKIALNDIDVQGVEEYKDLSQDVVAIFVLPPNYTVWRERLMKRYATTDEFEAEWPKRRDSAIKELKQALSVSYYHFIINDDLDRSVRIADEIAHQGDLFHRKDDEARLVARDILEEILANN